MNELVSIIVPVYNSQDYLRTTIDSVLNQSYQNFELILVNDGSTDASYEICKEYEKKDSRIHTLSIMNSGVAKARAVGVDYSKGEYITFLDSDDRLDKDFIGTMAKAIVENEADIVCCNSVDCYGICKSIEKNDVIMNDKKIFLDAFASNKRFAYCIWAKLFRKKSIDDICFPQMKYAEDTLYVQKCFNKVNRVVLLEYAGYYYTDNQNGAMHSSRGIRQALDNLKMLEEIKDLCVQTEISLCEEINRKMTIVLFNMICANASRPLKEWNENNIIIRKRIREHRTDIANIKRAVVVKAFYFMPNILNIAISVFHRGKSIKRKIYRSVG